MAKAIPMVVFVAVLIMISGTSALVPQLTLKWAFNTSAVFAGKTFGAGHQGCQTVWDIDGDGANEVLFGTRRGDSRRMWCVSQDGKFEWVYPPIAEEPLPGDPWGISIVDVNRDGKYEACISGRGGKLHVVKGDGKALWVWTNPNGPDAAMYGAPQAFDVDGDGFVEFFMADTVGYVHRVDHEGKLVWTSFKCGQANEGQAMIADIDRDGEYDVLWASNDMNLYCISANTGLEKWRFNAVGSTFTSPLPVLVVDVNKDGEYEAIIWTNPPSSAVFIVSFYGTELGRWVDPEGVGICMSPAFGDVNGDGNLDMAILTASALYLVDLSKCTTTWRKNVTDWVVQGQLPSGAVCNKWSSYPIIADFDGDGKQEILWEVPFPIVTDAATGALEAYYLNPYVTVGARAENGAWWGDVDKDGKSEWICELNGKSHPQTQLYCLTMNGKFPADSPWPEHLHSAYPAQYQAAQNWLTMKAAYSKSQWFPISQVLVPSILALFCLGLFSRKG